MNRGTKSIVIALAFLAASGGAFAQAGPTRTITVDEAVAVALENNIQLASTSIDLRMKKRAADFAWNVFLPTVQATGTMARTNMTETTTMVFTPMPGMATIELEEAQRWSAIGGLSLTLNLNAALFEGLKATRQNYEAGLIAWEQARQQTERNVRKAFYGILLQSQSLKLSRDKLAVAEERLKQVTANYRNGLLPELTFLQTRLGVEMQKPQIMEAELALAQQKSLFAFLIGLPVGTDFEPKGVIEPKLVAVDADALVASKLEGRLDLLALRKNAELLSTQLSASRLQRFTPSLSISQSFMPRLSPVDLDWLDGDNWKDSSGSLSFTLAWNLTGLLPFSTQGNAGADTVDGLRKLELAAKQARDNAEIEVRNLARKLEKIRSSLGTMELNVTTAEKAFALSEQAYRAGTLEYLDLKDAENTLLQARLGVLSERFNYVSTLLDLETAVNARLE